MGTPLGGSTAPADPGLKLRNVGDYATVAVVDLTPDLPRTIYGTDQPLLGPSGKPKTQHKVTCVVVNGTGVIAEKDAGDRPAQADEVVNIWIAGRDKWDPDLDKGRGADQGTSWSVACDRLAGGLQVGDILRWTFEAEVPGQGTQPRKVRTFRIRHPKPEEAALAAKCEELRRERSAIQLQPAGGGHVYQDDEPF